MTPHRIKPGPGQESVWDYPRPPRLENCAKRIRIIFNGGVIADTVRAKRVLETSHPPVYYLPPEDIAMAHLAPGKGSSFCEWKGCAHYYEVVCGDRRAPRAAWSYPNPTADLRHDQEPRRVLLRTAGCVPRGWRAGAPAARRLLRRMDHRRRVGPFKGAPGTAGW